MIHTTETVWQLFCCKLHPFIMKYVKDADIARDIEQDVFVKIHEKIDTLKDDTKVRGWVLQITRNTIMDCFRKHKIKLQSIDNMEFDDGIPSDLFHDKNQRDPEKEISSVLRVLVESLPEKYAEALILVEYQGISQVELARKLKLSSSAAKSRVQRARKMVRDRLMDCCHYEFDKYGNVIGVHPKSCHCCNH